MALSKQFLPVCACVCLSLLAFACDDSSSDGPAKTDPTTVDPKPGADCKADACKGDVLYKCDGGHFVEQDCTKSDQVCSNNACVPRSKTDCDGEISLCEDGEIHVTCQNHSYVRDDCAKWGMTCDTLLGCVSDMKCNSKDNTCDDNVSVVCDADVKDFVRVDCTRDNKICDPESHQCVYECDDSFVDSCSDAGVAIYCQDHHIVKDVCADQNNSVCDPQTKRCAEQCDDTYVESCTEDGKVLKCVDHRPTPVDCETDGTTCHANGECMTNDEYCATLGKEYDATANDCVKLTGPVIGTPCTCTNNCTIKIKASEFKKMISDDAKALNFVIISMNDVLGKIKDDEDLVIPNFYPGAENIKGCEALKSSAPAGMQVGCFHDGEIAFPPSLATALNSLGSILTMLAPDYASKLEKVVNLVKTSIQIKSTNGYCITGAIDISGTKSKDHSTISAEGDLAAAIVGMDGPFLNGNPLDKTTGMFAVNHVNVGDHDAIVQAANAAADNNMYYCPEGSSWVSRIVDRPVALNVKKDKTIDFIGTTTVHADVQLDSSIDAAIDLCLRDCEKDEDCRVADGYSCLEMKNDVTNEIVHSCFSKDTLDNLRKLKSEATSE